MEAYYILYPDGDRQIMDGETIGMIQVRGWSLDPFYENEDLTIHRAPYADKYLTIGSPVPIPVLLENGWFFLCICSKRQYKDSAIFIDGIVYCGECSHTKENNDLPFWEKKLEEIKIAGYNKVGNRVAVHTQQYIEQGFDDSDTWDLSNHLAQLILPRLERFKEINTIVVDFPLDEMIYAFQMYAKMWDGDGRSQYSWTEEERYRIQQGLKAFAEHYHRLWW